MILLEEIFEKTARSAHYEDALEEILCDENVALCRDFDLTQIQDSWSWRNVQMARLLAGELIDENGALNRRSLKRAITILEENLHSLGPNRYHDSVRLSHCLKILKHFSSEQAYGDALRRISLPEMNSGALQLIRDTLHLEQGEKVTHAHARKAVLAALLTYLRQNVGSCFATAPAIMIQRDQPLQFLADMGQLLGTGQLSRIYEGVEYAVPLSVNWGVGDLFKPISHATANKEILLRSPGLKAASIHEIGNWFDEENSFAYFTADDIIKAHFLNVHGVTEEDIRNYREQPLEGVVGEVVIQTSHLQTGARRSCERFIQDYELAKKAFVALTDNALLKAWEFSLASLSESKADFAKWNIYASLGVNSDEPHGIGESLYKQIQGLIERINVEVEAIQSRYDHLVAHVNSLQGRLQRASSTSEAEWLRAEYRMHRQDLDRLQADYEDMHEKGRRLSNILPVMVDFYGQKIRDYFQEVYDPGMHDVTTNPYDDSPAGFRLLYKYGRSNPSLWTMVNSAEEYIQHLSAFFNSTENELSQLPETEGLDKEISELVTTCIATIKRPEFIETSFFRLARVYNEPLIKNPIENLAKVKRKPWAYVSGGTMGTLVSCYYGIHNKPKEAKRWVESVNELLAFYIDMLKELPLSIQELFQKEPEFSLLAFSPTHAFICKPGWKLFRKAWESRMYTYTWIRDRWHHPQLNFLDDHILDSRMMDYLIDELLLFIPRGYRALVRNAFKSFPLPMRSDEFRAYVIKTLAYEKWVRGANQLVFIEEQLDSILYQCLPFFPEHALKDHLKTIFDAIEEIDMIRQKELLKRIEQLDAGRYRTFSAKDLRKIAKALLIDVFGSTRTAIPFHQKITEVMQANKLAYPEPILVADTNWVKNTFGFTVNPGTGELDFWRFDDCGSEGRPISIWRRYLNGLDRQEWGLYINPSQYGQFL